MIYYVNMRYGVFHFIRNHTFSFVRDWNNFIWIIANCNFYPRGRNWNIQYDFYNLPIVTENITVIPKQRIHMFWPRSQIELFKS